MKTPGENKVVPLLPRLITKKINLLFFAFKSNKRQAKGIAWQRRIDT